MAAELGDSFGNGVDVQLIEGAKGAFLVIADGKEVWNKRVDGRFPGAGDVPTRIRAG